MKTLLLSCVIFVTFLGHALAQSQCVDARQVAQMINEKFGEVLVGEGYNAQAMVQMYRNPETTSFSVVAILPDGRACMVIGGDAWEDIPPKPLVPSKES